MEGDQMVNQKFHKGDWVRVAKDLGPYMSHFTADCDAIVIGSYKDQYGRGDTESYTLHLERHGETSWYEGHQLTLIETGRLDKLKDWEDMKEAECREKGDLDWIFQNGTEVSAHPHGASIAALAKCLGCTNLWGSHGEGFVYYQNAMTVLALASPFLSTNDKSGWLKFCKEAKPATPEG